MADVKLINCTKVPLTYKSERGEKVSLEKGKIAKLIVKRKPLGHVNQVLTATQSTYEVVDLPAPSGNLVYVVEEDVYLHIAATGARVDVVGYEKGAKVKGEEEYTLTGLHTGVWIRQKPYFTNLAEPTL